MDRQIIKEKFSEAISREGLSNREAAGFINLHPCYVSMLLNNNWDGMSQKAWTRLEEWMNTRESIRQFVIPSGEEIWKPKEKPAESIKKEVTDISASTQNQMGDFLNAVTGTVKEIKKLKGKRQPVQRKQRIAPTKLHPVQEDPEPVQKIKLFIPEIPRIKVAFDLEINLVINGQRIALTT